MVQHQSGWRSKGNPSALRAVIVYENPALREPAIQFWQAVEKENPSVQHAPPDWCPFDLLGRPDEARRAAEQAARADLIVFSVSAEGDLPDELKLWIETWLGKRGEREGAIVGLVAQPSNPFALACFKEVYLRHIACRAGMDYLSRASPTAAKAMPDSLDAFTERAGQMSSVLDQILHTFPRPPAD